MTVPQPNIPQPTPESPATPRYFPLDCGTVTSQEVIFLLTSNDAVGGFDRILGAVASGMRRHAQGAAQPPKRGRSQKALRGALIGAAVGGGGGAGIGMAYCQPIAGVDPHVGRWFLRPLVRA